ncbi:MAG: substrate-binding domain-containing protein [Akkermansiaceae bacterium]
MQAWDRLNTAEQIANHLREELMRGRWTGMMPGQFRLAEELGASRNAVEAALRQLEHEGVLVSQGLGRKRLIASPDPKKARPMRIAILDYEPVPVTEGYTVELQYMLIEAGHVAFFAPKTLIELDMNVSRIRRMVEKTEADAWIVCSASREVLTWFAAQPLPAFALFGRRRGLPIAAAGPDKIPATVAATRALAELGHQRIVILTRRATRLPKPGVAVQAFLDELKAQGITPGPYNLPDWEENPKALHKRLELLFRITPPTALIADEAPFYVAALQFCTSRGLRVPQDVSLICADPSPAFEWSRPTVAHILWETRPLVRRIVRWAANVSQKKPDLRQTLTQAEFITGGTIGPVARAGRNFKR